MAEQLIYKVFQDVDTPKGKRRIEYANVYEDGSVDYMRSRNWSICLCKALGLPDPSNDDDGDWQSDVESDQRKGRFIQEKIKEENPMSIMTYRGHDDDGCPLINNRYQKALMALYVTTDGDREDGAAPPYKDSEFSVEYFGEGEPWERDPDWDPFMEY